MDINEIMNSVKREKVFGQSIIEKCQLIQEFNDALTQERQRNGTLAKQVEDLTQKLGNAQIELSEWKKKDDVPPQ